MPIADLARRSIGSTWRLLLKELGAFGVVGIVCFALDLALFQFLYVYLDTGPVLAKLVSTLVSMTVAYLGHRFWSFSHRTSTGSHREYLLFGLINVLTLGLSIGSVALVHYPLGQDGALALQLTNVVSTVLGTAIRYLSYRRWVFPAAPAPGPPPAAPRRPADRAPLRPSPAD